MAITAKDVKELRERTGVGMMECKGALEEAGGDMEKAIDLLRAKGAAKAAKRSAREASEGAVGSYVPCRFSVSWRSAVSVSTSRLSPRPGRRVVTCWTIQRLPSGSANEAYEP